MCYKSPGPRCSSHAAKAVTKAEQAYNADPSFENYSVLVGARDAYDMTPGGQKRIETHLKEMDAYAQSHPDDDLTALSQKRHALVERLDRGRIRRQHALAELRLEEQGDTQTSHQDEGALVLIPATGPNVRSKRFVRDGDTHEVTWTISDYDQVHEVWTINGRVRDDRTFRIYDPENNIDEAFAEAGTPAAFGEEDYSSYGEGDDWDDN